MSSVRSRQGPPLCRHAAPAKRGARSSISGMTASDAPEGDETDSSPVLPTHRRSTFEPPAAAFAAADGESVGTDDDALAAALAEELGRVTRTGSIPIQTVPASAELPETFEVPETPVFDVGVDAGNDPV